MSIKKQDEFLTKFYSQPVKCPACGADHSYVDVRGNADWSKEAIASCPNTGAELIAQVALLGGEYFLSLKDDKQMSPAEEKDWQALDDNMDWMSDEQIKSASEKIKAKYRK